MAQSRHQHDRTLCIAPMMGCSDRHFRYLMRQCSPGARLFTEMVTAPALIRGPRRRLLEHAPLEHPLVMQLGGSDPGMLATAARIATDHGYDEINLNVGCPSPRVKAGRFGACLMLEPELTAHCVAAMTAAVEVPVTVKCRLGVDAADSNELLEAFVHHMVDAGCQALYLHMRKAHLSGLSPRQNRQVPPLQPSRGYRLKQHFVQLPIVLNGGVADVTTARAHLQRADGVMIGREAYNNPMFVASLQAELFGGEPISVWQVLDGYVHYADAQMSQGVRMHDLTRHMHGLLKGLPGARRYRQLLSTEAHRGRNDLSLIHQAITEVRRRAA